MKKMVSTLMLEENFWEEKFVHHLKIKQMSEKYHITEQHIRKSVIPNVAKKYGVSREELLDYGDGRGNHFGSYHAVAKPINMDEFWEEVDGALAEIDASLDLLEEQLKEEV